MLAYVVTICKFEFCYKRRAVLDRDISVTIIVYIMMVIITA